MIWSLFNMDHGLHETLRAFQFNCENRKLTISYGFIDSGQLLFARRTIIIWGDSILDSMLNPNGFAQFINFCADQWRWTGSYMWMISHLKCRSNLCSKYDKSLDLDVSIFSNSLSRIETSSYAEHQICQNICNNGSYKLFFVGCAGHEVPIRHFESYTPIRTKNAQCTHSIINHSYTHYQLTKH